jgi:tartrate dehydratase alpha subunit/fumarate hydratase class I-like protein
MTPAKGIAGNKYQAATLFKEMANRMANYQLIQKTSDQSNGCSTSNLIETGIGTGIGNQSLLISGLQ